MASKPLVLLLLLSLLSLCTAAFPNFLDVTVQAGIDLTPGRLNIRKLLKYGGPTVADLDRDGNYDLIFVHHGSAPFQVYFNNGDGTFTKSPIGIHQDNHGTVPFLLPHFADCFFALAQGGFRGAIPNPPIIYRVFPNRTIIDVSSETGLDFYNGRGRSGLFLPLRLKKTAPDALFLNADASPERCPGCTDGQFDAYSYHGPSRSYKPRILEGFNGVHNTHQALAIDADNDGRMEIISWKNLTVHKITGNFKAKDISTKVLGEHAYQEGVAAIAEIDFDNDGDFDLYIARDVRGHRNSSKGIYPDLLLENRGGKYVDVGVEAGVPQDTVSRGVTTGDFNNDGLMDLYVSVFQFQKDFFLMNNGDGTFRRVDMDIGRQGAFGDSAMAVDYDNDGRVDIIRSEGDWGDYEHGGQFRILKNVINPESIGGWVNVRVGWVGNQTSQHAVVVVFAGDKRVMRRVGQNGVTLPHSYIDTLHFGIGEETTASVKVTWLNGKVRRKTAKVGETVQLGKMKKSENKRF